MIMESAKTIIKVSVEKNTEGREQEDAVQKTFIIVLIWRKKSHVAKWVVNLDPSCVHNGWEVG